MHKFVALYLKRYLSKEKKLASRFIHNRKYSKDSCDILFVFVARLLQEISLKIWKHSNSNLCIFVKIWGIYYYTHLPNKWEALLFILESNFHPRPPRLFYFEKISTLDMNFYVLKIFLPPLWWHKFAILPVYYRGVGTYTDIRTGPHKVLGKSYSKHNR